MSSTRLPAAAVLTVAALATTTIGGTVSALAAPAEPEVTVAAVQPGASVSPRTPAPRRITVLDPVVTKTSDERGTVLRLPEGAPKIAHLAYTAAKGEVLSFPLSSSASTGYSWTSELSPGNTQVVDLPELADPEYPEDVSELPPGASSHYLYRYQAVQEGTTTITLTFKRPWETTVAEQIVLHLTVAPAGR